jgi:hypothetical protein
VTDIITGPDDGRGVATAAEREAWERLWDTDTFNERHQILIFELGPMLSERLGTDDFLIDPNGPRPPLP